MPEDPRYDGDFGLDARDAQIAEQQANAQELAQDLEDAEDDTSETVGADEYPFDSLDYPPIEWDRVDRNQPWDDEGVWLSQWVTGEGEVVSTVGTVQADWMGFRIEDDE